LLAPGVAAEVLHEAVAEDHVVLPEAARACVGMNNLHPRLVRTLAVVIEVYHRDAGRSQSEDAPGDGRSPKVKDPHVREVRETAFEFFEALLTETVSKGSGMVRIDQFSNCSAGHGSDPLCDGFKRDRGTAVIGPSPYER
jgi:hypothetical protein